VQLQMAPKGARKGAVACGFKTGAQTAVACINCLCGHVLATHLPWARAAGPVDRASLPDRHLLLSLAARV
jgi:hypothetical protein